jgi:hypothetical protein
MHFAVRPEDAATSLVRSSRLGLTCASGACLAGWPQVKRASATRSGGFEPATRCLGGTINESRSVARVDELANAWEEDDRHRAGAVPGTGSH